MSDASIIGVGAMGSALASALLRDGHRVTVWNRTSAKAESLVRDGASPVVLVCVDNHDVTRDISLGRMSGAVSPAAFSCTRQCVASILAFLRMPLGLSERG